MLKAITVRRSQGAQTIPDPRQAAPAGFRGRPVIAATPCDSGCSACVAACPANAIELDPLRIDLGRCTLCGDCAPACPPGKLSFDNDVKLATTERAGLVLSAQRPAPDPVAVSAALKARFGRSLKLRSVSAGGCNGCELEVNALTNVNFDIGRYGIDIVASPRHADGLVLTGPITRNMAEALQLCWDGMPDPKLVIAVGACAISGGCFAVSDAVDRRFLERFKPSLYVPGCPPHPLTFVCGILDLLGIPS
ncbi:4Fe-4S dicluster domain-containing protein [Ideonella sp.]|uniref:NADH-quinone oxidoreductase subunit B family protein n=1 Tax=Ideonella sp. TaxID=1929293 RepID=UPI002B486297|nr:4Fe-4S dicluster domain-containing protein [Ideonella sp.]HJV68163.1 4Fe-4S dicluster domain-containing protein [Ideonella sp.]